MSARANPAVVGGFVVGALVLLVAAVLLFGSGAVLRERVPVVAFFSGNVRGLQEGSPVEFRGVRVGTVTELRLTLDVDSMDVLIPVYMELDPRSLTLAGGDEPDRQTLLYVGTPAGLAGLIADIHALNIADGAVLIPRAAGVAELIPEAVLPVLRTMARLPVAVGEVLTA